MSVAVAVRHRGQTVLATDSKRTFGSGAVPFENLSDTKMRKVGSAYLATTGWGLYSNILDDYLARKRARLTDQHSIFTFFRHFWRDLHQQYSFVSDQRGDDDSPFGDLDSSFLIVNPKGIFSVACDMSVTEFDQYYAIGSGSGYALGALHALHGSGSAEQTATKAIEAAIALDIYCGGTINVQKVKGTRKR